METTYHSYHFDLRTPEGKAGWADLRAKLANHPRRMESHGGALHCQPDRDGTVITLETKHLFDNQWNTAPIPAWGGDKGYRVFDWALDAPLGFAAPRHIRQGHYLDQTPEMREIRRNTMKCGYCGKQEPAAKGYVFCPHCLDSEYLKEADLKLTRMMPVDESGRATFKELTKAERGYLLPLYREAQLHGATERGKARAAAKRRDVAETYKAKLHNAKTEHDGFMWLLDHGINTDNVIYYSHTGRFGFGWRTPMGGEVLAAFLEVAAKFGWPYDIKTDDGRTLSGN